MGQSPPGVTRHSGVGLIRSSRWRDAIANTRDACVTRMRAITDGSGSPDHSSLRTLEQWQRAGFLLPRCRANREFHPKRFEKTAEDTVMLFRQDLGRRHERSLISFFNRKQN